MKETNMMFVDCIIIAIVVEYCCLYQRLALIVMRTVGCNPKRLSLALCFYVDFKYSSYCNEVISFKVNLKNKKSYNIPDDPNFDRNTAKSTNLTNGNYISIAFAATIDGVGTIIGTGTNLTFKRIYETCFPEATIIFIQMMYIIEFVSTKFQRWIKR